MSQVSRSWRVLLGLLFGLGFGIGIGCGDDWELVAHCATGQAQHVNDKLRCYAHDGSPVLGKVRPWMNDTPEQACAFCDGTEPIDGGQ